MARLPFAGTWNIRIRDPFGAGMNDDAWLQKRRKARLEFELDELETEAKVIALRRDQVAKELETLVIEMKVNEIVEDYPAFERELLRMSFV